MCSPLISLYLFFLSYSAFTQQLHMLCRLICPLSFCLRLFSLLHLYTYGCSARLTDFFFLPHYWALYARKLFFFSPISSKLVIELTKNWSSVHNESFLCLRKLLQDFLINLPRMPACHTAAVLIMLSINPHCAALKIAQKMFHSRKLQSAVFSPIPLPIAAYHGWILAVDRWTPSQMSLGGGELKPWATQAAFCRQMTRVVALIQNMGCMDLKLVSVLAHYWSVGINTLVTVLSCSAAGSTKRRQPGCQTRHFCISREQANVIFFSLNYNLCFFFIVCFQLAFKWFFLITSFKKIMHTNWLCFPVVSIDHINMKLSKEFISNLSFGKDITAVISIFAFEQ